VVVGAGIIGRAVAWRLARQQMAVTLVDPDPCRSAAQVAAGMLAPVTEAHYGQERLLELCLESARRWPGFAAELSADAGRDPGYVACGTLAVARDNDDLAELDRLLSYLHELGLDATRLRTREIRRREPALAPGVRGGLWVPGDHQVDPRCALGALERAAAAHGVVEVRDTARHLDGDQVRLAGGETLHADAVVACTGWTAGELLGLPVRPVKGQVLRLGPTTRAVLPTHVLRGLDVYLAARPNGEVVVGATVEEAGPDTTVTAGAVRRLLAEAWRLVPGLDEAPLIEAVAGLRPATPDGAPLLGTTANGVYVAAGHYRNGILLAPLTADLVVDAIDTGEWPRSAAPFGLDRFEPRHEPPRADEAAAHPATTGTP
jgi:glycine oxidase